MSNPAVTPLCNTSIAGIPFWMDDNIGESIHIHIGDVRVDLTNVEFTNLCNDICNALNAMIQVDGFDAHNINPVYFQDMLWKDLSHLKKVEFDSVPLRDMLCPFNGIYQKLPVSRAVRALEGDPKDNNDKRNSHHIGQTSEERLTGLLNSIVEKGYPYNNEYIVMYGNDNVIQDGQHRAACLWHSHGDISVPVMRFYFDNYIDFDKRTKFERSKFCFWLNMQKKRFGSISVFLKKVRSKFGVLRYRLKINSRQKRYLKKYSQFHNEFSEILSNR